MRSVLPLVACPTRRPRQTFKAALVLAFVFALAGTLAGCGSSPASSTSEPPAASPAPSGARRGSAVTLSRRSHTHETQRRGATLARTRDAQAER